jgi:hypothetical protein
MRNRCNPFAVDVEKSAATVSSQWRLRNSFHVVFDPVPAQFRVVFFRHPNQQGFYLGCGARSARPRSLPVILEGDQFPVPHEHRLGGDGAGDLRQKFPPNPLALAVIYDTGHH